jgi:hypothetical protein
VATRHGNIKVRKGELARYVMYGAGEADELEYLNP